MTIPKKESHQFGGVRGTAGDNNKPSHSLNGPNMVASVPHINSESITSLHQHFRPAHVDDDDEEDGPDLVKTSNGEFTNFCETGSATVELDTVVNFDSEFTNS